MGCALMLDTEAKAGKWGSVLKLDKDTSDERLDVHWCFM